MINLNVKYLLDDDGNPFKIIAARDDSPAVKMKHEARPTRDVCIDGHSVQAMLSQGYEFAEPYTGVLDSDKPAGTAEPKKKG